MVNIHKVEDRPTPKEVYGWKIHLNAFIAAFGAICFGYDMAFIGGTLALKSFQKEFGLTTANTSLLSANIVSTFQAGAAAGALLSYPVCEKWGRRVTLLLSGFFFTIGSFIQIAASHKTGLGPLYAGRVLTGLGVGAISLVAPIYIGEVSPPKIRGRLVGGYDICIQLGQIVGFWINYGLQLHVAPSRKQWLVPFAIQAIPGGLLVLGAFFLIESPRWLRSKGRLEDADVSLAKLRQLPIEHQYLQEEVAMIDAQLALENEHGTGFMARLRELNHGGVRKRMIIMAVIFIFQNATGINAINYYSPKVFASIGITGTNAGLFSTGIFGLCKVTTTIFFAFFLIDNIGRRRLLMIGAALASVFMNYIGAYIAIAKPQNHPGGKLTPGGLSAVVFLYLWTSSYGPTWNGTPWVLASELFPQHVRTIAQALQSSLQWMWNFAIARATPYMFTAMGYGVYTFFGCLTALGGIFVFFFLPETRGVPIEHMDKLFGDKWFGKSSGVYVEDIEEGKRETSHVERHDVDSEKRSV
ncbi:putative hexose transport-related protein [Meredithblackwellia eburnea MCA 4105]